MLKLVGRRLLSASPAAQLGAAPARRILRDNVYTSFEDCIGNTPLLLLQGPSEQTGCRIYGKCEFLNPGGSLKDRAALYLIRDAERRGLLTPGQPGIVVEGTAGNTGIGLALVANTRGYRTIIVIPETQAQAKKDMLRMAGAELVEVKAAPYKSPNHYVKISGRLAEALGGFWAQQFDNTANRLGHVESTGPEIWAQTNGEVDAFCASIGTGGTLAGVAMYLRSVKPDVCIGLTDPCGGALYRYYTTGELRAEGSSITEGIGQGRVTGNLEGFRPDRCYEIPDTEMLPVCFDLLRTQGLLLGGSAGINVAGAIRLARDLGPGKTIVTVLPDMATKYQNKMFNLPFLRAQHLPTPDWFEQGLSADVHSALESCIFKE